MRPILIPLITFVSMLAALPLAAQDSGRRTIDLRVACFQYVNEVNRLNLVHGRSGRRTEIEFHQGSFTLPLEVEIEGNRLNFYLPLDEADGDDDVPLDRGRNSDANTPLAASVDLPAGRRDASILLLPARPNEPLVYQAVLLPPQSELPYGSVIMMNLASTAVKYAFGPQRIEVPAQGVRVANPRNAVDDYHMYPVAIAFQSLEDGEWVVVQTTRWQWNQRLRQIAISWVDPVSERPDVVILRDIMLRDSIPVAED